MRPPTELAARPIRSRCKRCRTFRTRRSSLLANLIERMLVEAPTNDGVAIMQAASDKAREATDEQDHAWSTLARQAVVVYIRQSTAGQVANNLESKRRQYGLADRARQLGWSDVAIIDDDSWPLRRQRCAARLREAAGCHLRRACRRRCLDRGVAPGLATAVTGSYIAGVLRSRRYADCSTRTARLRIRVILQRPPAARR